MTPTETFDNLTKTNSTLAAAKSAFIDQCNAISPSKTNAEIAEMLKAYWHDLADKGVIVRYTLAGVNWEDIAAMWHWHPSL